MGGLDVALGQPFGRDGEEGSDDVLFAASFVRPCGPRPSSASPTCSRDARREAPAVARVQSTVTTTLIFPRGLLAPDSVNV